MGIIKTETTNVMSHPYF